jgi:flagellar hook assembly protein FlgD
MRTSSGYTFSATANSTREFKVQMDIGGAVRAVIGNLVVTRSGRDRNSPFTINYTLSSAASTTIRILGNNGKEVFTVTRGRADNAGENSATWNLKDNANRSVAPGTYRVEIVATTSEGDNVRRIVPVNVIR